jgi:hypothetical protein
LLVMLTTIRLLATRCIDLAASPHLPPPDRVTSILIKICISTMRVAIEQRNAAWIPLGPNGAK